MLIRPCSDEYLSLRMDLIYVFQVFEIFLKWIDELNSGSLGSEDIGFLKQGLLTTDYLVLPTAEDKWVSLNPSFGRICWCDDYKLRK